MFKINGWTFARQAQMTQSLLKDRLLYHCCHEMVAIMEAAGEVLVVTMLLSILLVASVVLRICQRAGKNEEHLLVDSFMLTIIQKLRSGSGQTGEFLSLKLILPYYVVMT